MASTQGKFSPLFSRKTAGGPFTIAGIDQVPGDVFFVDSAATSASDAATAGISPDLPFATLAYAFSSDRVTSGDVVYVMPGHAEDVVAAGSITMDIAGVRVVGLGRGTSRPTFTFKTATTATWLMSAANVAVENVLITTSGVINIASAITVTGADCSLTNVEIRDSAADSQFDDTIIIGTGGARCRVIRPIIRSHASGDAAQSGILISAAVDGVEIDDPNIDGLYATGNIESTAAATNTIIRRPILRQRHATQDAVINLHASNTGFVDAARIRTATNDTAGFTGAYVGAAMQFYDMLVVNAAGTAGSSPGTFAVPDVADVPGSVYFVSSTATGAADSAANGTTKELPFATLSYAFSSDRVTSGDTVYVMPSHAETVNAAGDITMDIAGVTVIGLGSGSSRPTFTYATDTASTWLISAANVTVKNVLITATGTIDVVNAIAVTGADCLLEDVEVREPASTTQFVDPLIISTGAARCRVVRYICRSHASGDAIQSGILISAVVDGVEIDDAQIDGLMATGCIESTAAATNTKIRRSELRQRHATQAAAVNLHASNTGIVSRAVAYVTLSTAPGFNGAYVGTSAVFDQCRAVNTAGSSTSEPLPALGRRVAKATGTLAATTVALFTVAGGRVGITAIYGIVDTAITVANSYKLVSNPTTGTTMDLCTATDLGTNDTPAGAVLSMASPAAAITGGSNTTVSTISLAGIVPIPVGQIESVSAGTDGEITWVVYWVPLDSGATLVAA
jgi:hypothetical protein